MDTSMLLSLDDVNILGGLIAIAIGIAIVKGFALYRAARNNDKVWFWFLLFLNTLGILPIYYLLTHKEKR